MPVEAMKPLVEALLAQLPDDPTSVVISVKSETEVPTSPNGTKSPAGPLYDPSMVYLLEFATVLALRDNDTITALGADVAEALQNVMRNAASYHSVMISRTMFYLLHLLHASYVSFASLVFPYLSNMNRNTLSSAFQLFFTQCPASRRISSTSLRHLFFKG